MSISTYIQVLQDRKMKMINYLELKTEEQDWHGVADAAMDLREIEVMLNYHKKLLLDEQK